MSLRAAVVGVRGIGANHAKAFHQLDEFELVGVCDLNPETLSALDPPSLGARGYTQFAEMLSAEKAEVVTIATNNISHHALALQAIAFGVRGVICEKPMTVHLRDARELAEACRSRGIALMVNHQRRLGPDLVTLRRLIKDGAIGKVQLVRACNAGDMLSDGTHAVDSVRYILGDPAVEKVFGQIFRAEPEEKSGGAGFDKAAGYRFGHAVEDSAMAVVQFAGGVRAEFFTGELFPAGRWYQDYEIFGERGRLWRPSDGQQPRVRVDRGGGDWEAVPLDPGPENPFLEAIRLFAATVERGEPHPMDGLIQGLADMEIVSAIYESARVRQPVTLPLEQDLFALEMMLEEAK